MPPAQPTALAQHVHLHLEKLFLRKASYPIFFFFFCQDQENEGKANEEKFGHSSLIIFPLFLRCFVDFGCRPRD